MIYVWLAVAVVFEVGWAVAMKLSAGFTRPAATAATIVMYLLSVVFLALATKRMDVGVAYATWAGAGVALIAVVGMTYFKEPASAVKFISIGLIVLGIAGLQFARGGH
jgi:small multidrug resistance pump